ncbi:hypothetical protein FJZ26_02865 [Candidatus Parvarchaeota archaeon]|nr:hypothetical protein [Candidatus Parvarchaeota archaeon]
MSYMTAKAEKISAVRKIKFHFNLKSNEWAVSRFGLNAFWLGYRAGKENGFFTKMFKKAGEEEVKNFLHNRAIKLENKGKFKAASECWAEIAYLENGDKVKADHYARAARNAETAGLYEDAGKYFEKAARHYEKHVDLPERIAQLKITQLKSAVENYTKAIEWIEKLPEKKKDVYMLRKKMELEIKVEAIKKEIA